jgi:beta-galactosidase
VGISRALINANIPWEHVTASDVRNGLAARYKVIYLPAQAAINDDLWPLLDTYVKNGGRLVLDAPGGWWDEQGRVLQTGKGTAFENIFGATIADFQYSNNVKFKLANHTLNGFVLHIRPGAAKVVETFQNGEPAVTEHTYGKGKAIILAPDASFSMRRQGNSFMEQWTVKHTMGSMVSPYTSSNAVVYRLAAPKADHYFFLNDGEPTTTIFSSSRYTYKKFTDAITGDEINPKSISIEGYSGRWVRAEK